MLFNTCETDHGKGRRPYRGRADTIAVDVPDLNQVFMVPVDDCPSYQGFLRLEPPRDNQRGGIRFAADYEFECWIRDLKQVVDAKASHIKSTVR